LVICISIIIRNSIFSHADIRYKYSLENGIPLRPASHYLREILVIDTLRCEMFSHVCSIKCSVVINNAILHSSYCVPFLAMLQHACGKRTRFNMWFNARQTCNKFDRSYGYCVRNIHIRRVLRRCRCRMKRWITATPPFVPISERAINISQRCVMKNYRSLYAQIVDIKQDAAMVCILRVICYSKHICMPWLIRISPWRICNHLLTVL